MLLEGRSLRSRRNNPIRTPRRPRSRGPPRRPSSVPFSTFRQPSCRSVIMPAFSASWRITPAFTRVDDQFADRVVGHHQLVDAGPAAEPALPARPAARSPCTSVGAGPRRSPFGARHLLDGRPGAELAPRPAPAGSRSAGRRCPGRTSTLQSGQMVRTSRWAITPSTVLATRNGSTPMSISRVNGAGRVVGVQRAEHQVAGERRLDGDLGRFQVAHFADQDHVRVVPQDAPQGGGERQADLGVHLDLADARLLVLDRVFDRDDLDASRP